VHFLATALLKQVWRCPFGLTKTFFCLLNDCKDRTFFRFNGIKKLLSQTFLVLLHLSINDTVHSLRLRFRMPNKQQKRQ